jgi:hypothetical protein
VQALVSQVQSLLDAAPSRRLFFKMADVDNFF